MGRKVHMNGNKCIDLKGIVAACGIYVRTCAPPHQHKKDSQMYYIVLCREMQLREAFFLVHFVLEKKIFLGKMQVVCSHSLCDALNKNGCFALHVQLCDHMVGVVVVDFDAHCVWC